MRAILVFLSPITLSFEDWLAWRDQVPSAPGAEQMGQGAPLEELTRHGAGGDWRRALAEVFVKSRRNEGFLAALPKTVAALAHQMRGAFSSRLEIETWVSLAASRHDGPCLVFAIQVQGAAEAFAELDPKAARAAFDAAAFKSTLPWREDCEALGLAIPQAAAPAADATHLLSFLFGVETPPTLFLRAHGEEEGGAANAADMLAAADLGVHYCRPGYSYSTLAADEASPILFLLPLIVRAQTVWNALNGFRGALLDAARARRAQNSASDADASVFFERVRFDFELWRVELDGFEGALRPWQRALFQDYAREWSFDRSRSLVSEGLTRLGALLEARLRRSTLRAETTQSRVLFILAVLQVIGLVGVASTYLDLLDRGGVNAIRLLGVQHYLLFLAAFFGVTAITSAVLAFAARGERKGRTRV